MDNFAHTDYAATSRLYETIQRTKDQQKLPVQTEPQECLKENNEDMKDQIEADEDSELQFSPCQEEPKDQSVSLGEEKSLNVTLLLSTHQDQQTGSKTQRKQTIGERKTEIDENKKQPNLNKKAEQQTEGKKTVSGLAVYCDGNLFYFMYWSHFFSNITFGSL